MRSNKLIFCVVLVALVLLGCMPFVFGEELTKQERLLKKLSTKMETQPEIFEELKEADIDFNRYPEVTQEIVEKAESMDLETEDFPVDRDLFVPKKEEDKAKVMADPVDFVEPLSDEEIAIAEQTIQALSVEHENETFLPEDHDELVAAADAHFESSGEKEYVEVAKERFFEKHGLEYDPTELEHEPTMGGVEPEYDDVFEDEGPIPWVVVFTLMMVAGIGAYFTILREDVSPLESYLKEQLQDGRHIAHLYDRCKDQGWTEAQITWVCERMMKVPREIKPLVDLVERHKDKGMAHVRRQAGKRWSQDQIKQAVIIAHVKEFMNKKGAQAGA